MGASPLKQPAVLGTLPPGLRDPLVEEFNKILRNFRERRWEPAELDGGKLCEIVYSILKGHVDGSFPASPSKPPNMYDACQRLEQARGQLRSIRIQIPRMLIALYEIRNNRGVGHVGGDVDPNQQDSAVVVSMSQWIMAELVRVFHKVDLDTAAAAVETLVERTIPLVWGVNGSLRVLNPSLTARDKALVVLYSARRMTAAKLAVDVEYKNLSRFRDKVIGKAHAEKLLNFDPHTDQVVLSPLGARYVETEIDLEVS
ncbi:MAG: hypothetical protein F4X47_11620 [Gammaproteobacteria bacterium]|nr:hypothetical protein [Gammaproteobacteria bacterium]MYC52952.1 hypothetical protein [Gammaproteobacteria bacterium]